MHLLLQCVGVDTPIHALLIMIIVIDLFVYSLPLSVQAPMATSHGRAQPDCRASRDKEVPTRTL